MCDPRIIYSEYTDLCHELTGLDKPKGPRLMGHLTSCPSSPCILDPGTELVPISHVRIQNGKIKDIKTQAEDISHCSSALSEARAQGKGGCKAGMDSQITEYARTLQDSIDQQRGLKL